MIWNFWNESIKKKWPPQPLKKWHGGSGGHFFSLLFLDIDGQSLRLRGPVIN